MSDNSPLSGKTALVTGAARRIGRACALSLAQAGARVIVHYHHSDEEAADTVSRIRRIGEAAAIHADLNSEPALFKLMEKSLSLWGGVDILINSASTFGGDDMFSADIASLEKNLRIHTAAPLYLSRLLYSRQPSLNNGNIINFLDTRITDYDKKHLSYHLSKQNLFSLTRMMAAEFAPRVKVNAIAPGLILPPPGEDEEYLSRLSHTNPMNTTGSLEDITQTLIFLLTNSFITGQVVFVDGGRHLQGSFYGL
ncbi:MAG: SDR family oxidoreductase [Spirochaetales bacterium]|nr:SDR family oxidoreductase [Spirochaetales bacterium]